MSETMEMPKPDVTPGVFGWNELITSDPEAAKCFYAATFGWSAHTETMAPGHDYTVFKLGERPVAGMIGITPEMGPEVRPHWLAYVNSDDVAADLDKARAAGAMVLVEPREIPNAGTLAIFLDPQGAAIALWRCLESATCG